jgi:hypothetical protein
VPLPREPRLPSLDRDKLAAVLAGLADGTALSTIARKVGVGYATVARIAEAERMAVTQVLDGRRARSAKRPPSDWRCLVRHPNGERSWGVVHCLVASKVTVQRPLQPG